MAFQLSEFMPVRYGSEQTGPKKGVPYDAALTPADGKGKWWEGMDPQDLCNPASRCSAYR
jgi:hypothetical protein